MWGCMSKDWDILQERLEELMRTANCNYCGKNIGRRFHIKYDEKTGIEEYYHYKCVSLKWKEDNK